MRKCGLISCLAVASLITVYACTLDSTLDPSPQTGDVAAPGNAQAPSTSPDETAPVDPSESVATEALTGCGRLNYCDNPNSATIGTDCTNLGCSFAAAAADCMAILASKTCNFHCKPVMRNSAGTITYTGFSCGGHCCPYGSQYCGPRGACCDGVHFNANCPPL